MNVQEQLKLGRAIAQAVTKSIEIPVTVTWAHDGQRATLIFNLEGNQDSDAMCTMSIPALIQLADPVPRITWWFREKGLLTKSMRKALANAY